MLPGQVSKPALHSIADHGIADRFAHDEPSTSRSCSPVVHQEVDYQGARTRPAAFPSCLPEVFTGCEPVLPGQQGRADSSELRRRACCGPCGGARTGWRGRRGCACAGGNRAPCGDDGCSAGRYACSRRSISDSGFRGLSTPSARGSAATSAGTAHPRPAPDAGLSWTCGTGRHRVTEQRYALGENRVKPTYWEPVDEGLIGTLSACYVRTLQGSPPPRNRPSQARL